MAFKTDKASINQSALTSNVLDVSGNAIISSLKGTGYRVVTVGTDGSLSTSSIPTPPKVYGLFGDGSLGDVTLDVSTTLSRDMNYYNLTINSNVWLNTAGFVLRVFGTLTINSGGHIACDGGNGGNGTATAYGSGGAPPYYSSSIFPFIGIPSGGGNGAVYVSAGTSASAGATGGASSNSVTYNPPPIIRAGAGGGGGGAVGSGSFTAANSYNVDFAAGAGGTGKSAVVPSASTQGCGGGGGGGGGVLIIYANTINNAGSIHANGGNGGNGYYVSGVVQAGGGGGGGGGTVIVFYRKTTGSGLGTITANAGSAGSYGTGGTSATNGIVITYNM